MAKDKLKFELNPITGELDLVKEFNSNRIVTHYLNSTGQPSLALDQASNQYLDLGPLVVVDNDGNVVVV